MTHCTDSTVEYCTIWFYPPLDPVSLSLDQPDCLFSWPHSVSIHSDLIPLRHGYFAIIMSVSIHSNPYTHLFTTFYISVARDGLIVMRFVQESAKCILQFSMFSSFYQFDKYFLPSSLVRCLLLSFTVQSASSSLLIFLPHFRCCSLNLHLCFFLSFFSFEFHPFSFFFLEFIFFLLLFIFNSDSLFRCSL